jgi:hypothetical protein
LIKKEVSKRVEDDFIFVDFSFSWDMRMISNNEICALVYELVSKLFLSRVCFDFVFCSSMERENFEITVEFLHLF